MFRWVHLFVAISALSGFANHNPITSFPAGTYLGEGHYLTANGTDGTYSTHIQILENEWVLTYLQNGKVSQYEVEFDLNDRGIFSAQIHKIGTEETYEGEGFCGRVQCHINVNIGDHYFEETITFASWENRIYRFGSIKKLGESDDARLLTWDEQLVQFNSGDDSGDGERVAP